MLGAFSTASPLLTNSALGSTSSEPSSHRKLLSVALTWLDVGGERTAAILSIIGTCIAHDVNPRAYLHLVTKLIVHGWPQQRLRELLPDRMLATYPELYVGDRSALPAPSVPPALGP